MKKAVVALSILLMMLFSFTVCAEPGAFLVSPSANADPEVIEIIFEEPKDEQEVKVTGYANRRKLTDSSRTNIEKAYETIKNSKTFNDVSKTLTERAKQRGISERSLSVSDLFDISYFENGIQKDKSGNYRIKLSAETLEYFVDLLQFVDGKWEIVEGATVDGHYLTFKSDKVGAFAIVTNNPMGAKTGDTVLKVAVPLFVCAVALLAVVIIVFKLRSGKKNEEE